MNYEPTQPLDTRLLNAMKRLRLENIQLQKQLRALQSDYGQASSQATDAAFRGRDLELQLAQMQQQLQDYHEIRLRVESLEAARVHWENQREMLTQLAQRQTLELQELRTLLHNREDEVCRLQHLNHAGLQEIEQIKHQARQVIVQHYQAMKRAEEQAQIAQEEARRSRAQLDAIRAPMSNGRRKVLPPRSLRPKGSLDLSRPGGNN